MHLTHLIRHVCRAFVGSSLLIPKLFGERFLLQLACARILLRVDERATSRIEKSLCMQATLRFLSSKTQYMVRNSKNLNICLQMVQRPQKSVTRVPVGPNAKKMFPSDLTYSEH